MAQIFSIDFPELAPSTRQTSRRSSRANTACSAKDNDGAEFDWVRIRDLLSSRFNALQRDLHLLDYERNGRVQKNDLRALLTRHSVRLSDAHFDRIWKQYDIHGSGTIEYHAFLASVRRQSAQTEADKDPNNLRASLSTAQPVASAPAALNSVRERTQLGLQKSKTFVTSRRENKMDRIAENDEALQQTSSAQLANGLHIVEVQRLVREKIMANYSVLKRAFLALDRASCGFLKTDDFRNVLHSFVYQLTDEQFKQVMSANDIRTQDGRVSWNVFLSRFRSARNSPDLENLVASLRQHLRHDFLSLRQAFLEVDYDRDGKISRSELQHFIERFLKRRMSDLQVHDLMIALDPDHTNLISYHQFLDLFELREDEEALRWMSDRRNHENEQSARIHEKAASSAWQAVLDLLSNRAALNLAETMKLLSQHSNSMHLVLPKDLKRILEQIGGTEISDTLFNKLVKECWMSEDGRIKYREFFSKHLRVNLDGAKVLGVSEKITHQSEVNEHTRLIRLAETSAQLDSSLAKEVGLLTTNEVFNILSDCVNRQRSSIADAFKKFSPDKMQMSKAQLRRMIESFGLLLNDDAFEKLISIKFAKVMTKDTINYEAFCRLFENKKSHGLTDHVGKGNVILQHMGEVECSDADQLENQIREKLRYNFVDWLSAFKQFVAHERDGLITRSRLKQGLIKMSIFSTDKAFDLLCKRLGLVDENTLVGYHEFVGKFASRAPSDDIWKSTRKLERLKSTKKLTAEEVAAIVRDKAHSQHVDLVKAFISFDKQKHGYVTRDEFRDMLEKEFHLPMTATEYDKLWLRYDPEGAGHLDYHMMMHNVGLADRFATGDFGTSQRIISENSDAIDNLREGTQARLASMEENQRLTLRTWPTKKIIKFLSDALTSSFIEPFAALKHYDRQRKGHITFAEFKRMMHDAYLYVTDRQAIEVLKELGVPEVVASTTGDSTEIKVYPKHFMKIFAVDVKPDKKNLPVREQSLSNVVPITTRDLPASGQIARSTVNDVEDRLRQVASTQYDILYKAFQTFDKPLDRAIRLDYFRRILDCFCFDTYDKPSVQTLRLSDSLFANLIASKWSRFVDETAQADSAEKLRMVRYADFLDYYAGSNKTEVVLPRLPTNTRSGSFVLPTVVEAETPRVEVEKTRNGNGHTRASVDRERAESSISVSMSELPRDFLNVQQIESFLRRKLHLVWRRILAQCRVYDMMHTGYIPMGVFKGILEACGCHLNDADVYKLLKYYQIVSDSDYQAIRYKSFLEKLLLSGADGEMNCDEKVLEILLTIRSRVLRHLTEMKRELSGYDSLKIGHITVPQFKSALQKRGIEFNEEDWFYLTSYLDSNMSGQIDYHRFLHSFIHQV